MLGCFPYFYPDELVYSACGRYIDRMGFTNSQFLINEMFDHHRAIAIVDLPCHLTAFVSTLPPGHKYNVNYLIDNHTLLPFYEPFLPDERVDQVRRGMSEHDHKIASYVGAITSDISANKWLRFCPKCVVQDRYRFGECYWHRLHQVPGVEICLEHLAYLQDSSVSKVNRNRPYAFISAERSVDSINIINRQLDEFDYALIPLAEDIRWLLNNHNFTNQTELRSRYLYLLSQNDALTPGRQVRVSKIMDLFIKHYSPELLSLLRCELREGINQNWLLRLLAWIYNPKSNPHPLHHLLFMNIFRFTTITFFGLPSYFFEPHPFGIGPWPCLNMASDHYGEGTIPEYQLTYRTNGKNVPTGTFACSCGFVYTRLGPDRSSDDIFRRDRIISHGNVWNARLRELWDDSNFSVAQTAKQLGISSTTVLVEAARQGLTFPKPGSKFSGATPPERSRRPVLDRQKKIEEDRSILLNLLQSNPNITRTEIRTLEATAYQYLRKYDPDWLATHMPPLLNNSVKQIPKSKPFIDWAQRDLEILELVQATAQSIKSKLGRPICATRTAIIKNTGYETVILGNLDKLPLVKKALFELSETREECVARRIYWAADCFKQEGIRPTRNHLIQRAFAHPYLELSLVKEAIDTVLEAFT